MPSTRLRRIRRLAFRTGAGAAAAGLLGVALLGTEAVLVSRRTFLPADSAPPVEGEYGTAPGGAVRVVLVGDSTAAGVGAHRPEDTVGAHLALLLAANGHRIDLFGVGISGSRARDLGPQVSRALLLHPDVAVILIGANDATHVSSLSGVRRHLGEAVKRLRDAGIPVVVGTCPDMGAGDAFLPPLRSILAWEGRRMGAAERSAVLAAGGVPVDIAALTGREIRSDRNRYLSEDRFHPSGDGYLLWAQALLPSVASVVGVRLPG